MLRTGLRDPVWTRSCVKRKTNSCSTPGAGPAAGRVPRPGLQNVGARLSTRKRGAGVGWGGVLNDGRKEVGGRRRGKTETAAQPSGRGRPFGTNSWEKVTLDNNRFVGRRLPPALRWGPWEKSCGLWLEAPRISTTSLLAPGPLRATRHRFGHGEGGALSACASLYAGSVAHGPGPPSTPPGFHGLAFLRF